MSVTNNATLIEDHETAPTYTSVGGGQGAGTETNFYFKGVAASSRKMSGVTKSGFWFQPPATEDISAAGTHVKMFINAITQAGFTDFWIRIGSSTSAYEEHAVGIDFYDNEAGGWIPVWVEVDAGTDSGSPDFTVIDQYAVLCDMSTISGNVKNWVTDQAHHATRPVLLWDGTAGDLDDFVTTEVTAGTGTLKLLNGLYTCYSNIKIGSATSTTFDMIGKTVAFPDAQWLPAASVWMGIDFDLAHASTDISATGGSFISGNPTGATARKPSIIVTGTSGVIDFSTRQMDGMRIVDFTTGVTMNGGVIANSGLVTIGGADLAGTSILTSAVAAGAGAAASLWDTASDPNGELDNMTFTKGTNAHHAIRFGTNTPATITLTGWTLTGFNALDDQTDSALYFDDTGSDVNWTVNVNGGTGNFKYHKARAGDTVSIVVSPVALLVTAKDATTSAVIEDAIVTVEAGDALGDLFFEVAVTISASGTTATVAHTAHGLITGAKVNIQGVNLEIEYTGVQTITVTGVNEYTYVMAGSPSSPASTPINSTEVILSGLSDVNGEITASRTYSADQKYRGFARKSDATPFYKTANISGTLDKDLGESIQAQLISDE